MSEDRNCKDFHHQHKGKTSEARLDKKTILDVLRLVPGQIIIDAGCGNGYMTKEFAELVKDSGKVYALDIDSEVIDQLKTETSNSHILPMIADISQTVDIEDNSADLIYLSTVFHGFSQVQITGFVEQVQRLLKPNAVLAILEMEKKEADFGPPLNIRVSASQLKQMIGLEPKQTVVINNDFYMQLFINKTI